MDFGRLGVLRWAAGGGQAAATMGGTEPAAAAAASANSAKPATLGDANRERFAIKKSYSIEVSF